MSFLHGLRFLYFFFNGEVCAKCGGTPSYKIGDDPLCSKCFYEHMNKREEKEDHTGMVQGYDGQWRWL